MFQHTGRTPRSLAPIPLGTVADGDSIRVVANNSPYTCGDISRDPFKLICLDTGVEQGLDSIGYPGHAGGLQRGILPSDLDRRS